MQKSSVKLILRPVVNDKKESPIYIRITVDRKTAYISTGEFVKKTQWNPKNETVKDIHPLSETTNAALINRKNEIIRKISKLNFDAQAFSAKSLKELFTSKDINNIFNFIDAYCIEVKHKKDDQTIEVYKKHARKLEKFRGSRSLNFEDITVSFLSKYEKWLRQENLKDDQDKDKRNNYVHAIWKTLKTFFNAARKKKLITTYPFGEYENPIYKDPQKDYLTLDELSLWERFADETKNPVHKITATYFLFGCYSGLRISDWYRFHLKTHVVDGMIKLRAKKNGEWLSIPLNGPLARNVERMRLLPLSIEEQTLNEKLKEIAEKLEINKSLTSHCGRKTFAVTMCADRGVSSETCAELMGITVAVCVKNYYAVTDYKIKNEVMKAWSGL